MSRLAQRTKKEVKFTKIVKGHARSVRLHSRCPNCGRTRAFLRKFQLCRICFRLLALRGDIPGVVKSSW